MTRRHLLSILAVALVVILAGCGTASIGQPSVTDGPPETTATPSLSPTSTDAQSATSANGTLAVHFLNVGQGGSTLVVGPSNETMVIDTGDWRDDGKDVLSYLRQRNITQIDHLVTTHADADHIGGHSAVIEYFETEAQGVGAVWDPGIASSSQTYEEYLDAIDAGRPVACSCPADAKYDHPCKHRVALSIRRPILEFVVATDAREAVKPENHSRHHVD